MSSQHDLLNVLRQDLPLFAMKAFNIVNPGQDLIPTAPFWVMAHKLSEVAQGRIRRLIVNVPPRSGKSSLASVALPAYMLGRDPLGESSAPRTRASLPANFRAIAAPSCSIQPIGCSFPTP
jgi:hypothetical protein